mmetsp:Transcript_128994/g.412400  ORF Transcript_128994/g.412400 Transcript_128994/m.412400 type:complete len:86 (+) Transcript_128994:1286-1543(+)
MDQIHGMSTCTLTARRYRVAFKGKSRSLVGYSEGWEWDELRSYAQCLNCGALGVVTHVVGKPKPSCKHPRLRQCSTKRCCTGVGG